MKWDFSLHVCYKKLPMYSRSKTTRHPFTQPCKAQDQTFDKDVRSR
jgi:hypothetical protein